MQQLSDKAKHRLKITARFLRQDGYRFDNGNFYEAVIATISRIDEPEQERLKGLVDWVENYELTESIYWDTGTLPRVRKSQNQSGKKKAMAAAPAAHGMEASDEDK